MYGSPTAALLVVVAVREAEGVPHERRRLGAVGALRHLAQQRIQPRAVLDDSPRFAGRRASGNRGSAGAGLNMIGRAARGRGRQMRAEEAKQRHHAVGQDNHEWVPSRPASRARVPDLAERHCAEQGLHLSVRRWRSATRLPPHGAPPTSAFAATSAYIRNLLPQPTAEVARARRRQPRLLGSAAAARCSWWPRSCWCWCSVVNPCRRAGRGRDVRAARGADGVDDACAADIEARAAARGVVDVTLEIGVYNPTIFGADILGLGAAVHVAGALDEDAAPLADGEPRRRSSTAARSSAAATATRPATARCAAGLGLIEVPCTIALSAPLSAGVSALISNRTPASTSVFGARRRVGATFESSRGGSATVWMSMENSTDAMSSLREQWGGGSVTITSSTSNGRIEPGAGGAAAATPPARRRRRRRRSWNGTRAGFGIEELTQMSALLVDLCGASALRELGDVLGDAADCILPGAGGVIDGIIGGIGDIGDAIGGIIGGIGGGSTASPPPAARRRPAAAAAAVGADVRAVQLGVRRHAHVDRRPPGSNAAETGLVAAAAGVLPGDITPEAAPARPTAAYRYSGTLVTYCCEKYACDGCGLIGGGGRRRAEAEAAEAEAAAGGEREGIRGLQLGGDSCANNVQASALSVRVDIAVSNPTMFAFIGRGANVTIHDAEGGLLATGTVPVVPVSCRADDDGGGGGAQLRAGARDARLGRRGERGAGGGGRHRGRSRAVPHPAARRADGGTHGRHRGARMAAATPPQHLDQDERA